MSNKGDKTTQLIVRLIGLTNSSKIKWERENPDSRKLPAERRYRGFVYIAEAGSDIFRISEYEYRSYLIDEEQYYWTPNVELEIIDCEGRSLWVCPSNPAIHDLYEIVVESTANIDAVVARLDSLAQAS